MKIIVLLAVVLFVSCSAQERDNGTSKIEKDQQSPQKTDTISTGWSDNDTYTVNVTGENVTKAKQKARFQILKDIVNVRMRSQSKYTDIEKISNEFDTLFKNAEIIKKSDHSDGVEIYYQIKETGLKSKFERK